MSTTVIDTNVVQLQFDSQEFVKGVNTSKMAVEELKNALAFDSNSFDALSKAANNIDLSTVAANIESLSDRFSTFGIVGMTVIERLTNAALDLGKSFAGLLAKPWNQILTGGWNRAANISGARFQLQGLFGKDDMGLAKLNMTMSATSDEIERLTGLTSDMAVTMNAADYAVADTAYGLDSAAKAASVLATSGIDVLNFSEDLKDANGLMRTEMQVALRSISGVAAMANTSYDEIAHVFERVAGNGRIMAIDLQSLSARGLNAAATLRDYLNDIGRTANATEADIRDMVSRGEIDFMTFAMAMDEAYGDHAKDANSTFSGALSNMKFALSKIGADFISPLRSKMVPIFNDVRIAINQFRKALNFKMKLPGIEDEISLVDAFARLITNLTEKAHDFFAAWTGGQDVLENTISAFSMLSGSSYNSIKKIFDEVENGSRDSVSAINDLVNMANKSGFSLDKVYKELASQMNVTEDKIISMCYNGEVSFEAFSNAMSSVFGDSVNTTRIEQLASVVSSITQIFINLGDIVASVVGPAIKAFFDEFSSHSGINGIVSATQAFADFIRSLIASRDTQLTIYAAFRGIATIIKIVVKVIKALGRNVFLIIREISPLVLVALKLITVFTAIVTKITNIIVESKLLTSVVSILVKILTTAADIIVSIVSVIFNIASPAINAIAEVFAAIARGIGTIDLSYLTLLIDKFRLLVLTFLDGGIITSFKMFTESFFGAIEIFFAGIGVSFGNLNRFFANVATTIANVCDRIITIIKNLKTNIVNAATKLKEWLSDFNNIINLLRQSIALFALTAMTSAFYNIGRIFQKLKIGISAQTLETLSVAVKNVARAVLEFAIGVVLLSSVPTDQVESAIKLLREITKAIAGLLVIYAVMQIMIAKINNSLHIKPWAKFLKTLTANISNFLKVTSGAVTMASAAVALLALVGAIALLFKSLKMYADLDSGDFEKGMEKIVKVIGVLVAAMMALVIAAKPIKNVFGGNNNNIFQIGGSSGLIGAAVAMLAIIIALKAFEEVIIEYNNLKFVGNGKGSFESALYRIANTMVVLVGGIALIGLTSKKAGTGLMASVVAMLAIAVVLKMFESIILEYAGIWAELEKMGDKAWYPFVMMGIIIAVITGAIVSMALAVRGANSSLTTLNRNAEGTNFKNDIKTTPLFGMVMMFIGMALFMLSMLVVIKSLSVEDMNSFYMVFITLAGVLGGLYAISKSLQGVKGGSVAAMTVMIIAIGTVIMFLSVMDPIGALTSAVSIGIIFAALSISMAMVNKVAGSSAGFMKNIGQLILSVAMLSIISIMLATLTEYDWQKMMASGLAMGATLVGIGMSINAISKVGDVNVNGIVQMLLILATLSIAVQLMNFIKVDDPFKLVTIAGCISLLGVAMGVMMKSLGDVDLKKCLLSIVTIGVAITAIGGILALLSAITNAENIFAVVTPIIILGVVYAAIGALMTKATAGSSWGSILATMGGIVGTLVGVLLTLIVASNWLGDSTVALFALTASTILLIPFIIAVARLIEDLKTLSPMDLLKGGLTIGGILVFLGAFAAFVGFAARIGGTDAAWVMVSLSVALLASVPFLFASMIVIESLSKLEISRLLKGGITLGAIMLFLGAFVAIIAFASLLNAEGTAIILQSLNTNMIMLSVSIMILAGVVAIIGAAQGLITPASIGMLGMIMLFVALFVNIIAIASRIGDPKGTALILDGLGMALLKLLPVIVVLGVLALALGALMATGVGAIVFIAGFAGMAAMLIEIALFAQQMAKIAAIGDVMNTLYLISNLGNALMKLGPLIIALGVLTALMATVAPLIAVGTLALSDILACVSEFVLALANIGTITDPATILTSLSTIIVVAQSLIPLFSVMIQAGVLAMPLVPLSVVIFAVLGSMLGIVNLLTVIGVMGLMVNAGINAILNTVNGLVSIGEIGQDINLIGLAKFITAVAMMNLVMSTGLMSLIVISTLLMIAGTNLSIVGRNESDISKGTQTAYDMVSEILETALLIRALTKAGDSSVLEKITSDVLATAAIVRGIGSWVGISLANGVLSPSSLRSVILSGQILSYALEESIRNTLQIHSESPKLNKIGWWGGVSTGNGFVKSTPYVENCVSSSMDKVGGLLTNICGNMGDISGAELANHLGEAIVSGMQTVGEFLGQLGQNYADAFNYRIGNYDSVEAIHRDNAEAIEEETDAWSDFMSSIGIDTDWENIIPDFNELLGGDDPFGTDNFIENLLNDFELPLDDLGSIGDLDTSLDGLGASADQAATSTSKLKDSIDDLIEKYEDLWDDAKERANKDLFKGVDEQGDDFLDKVEDIMDQYRNIYETAVEKTNSEDLFAEVNDEDESFAPDTLLNNLEDQVNQVNELNTIIGSLSGRIADDGLRAAISQMSVDELPELRAMYRMDNGQLREYEKLYKQKVQANQNKIQNELTGSLSQLTGQYTDVATYVATDASTDRLIRNLQSQIDQLNEYNATVSSLMDRVSDLNLREAIAHMGVDSLAELKALNSMTDEQLDEYIALYNKKIHAGAQEIRNELSTELSALMGKPLDIAEFYAAYKNGMTEFGDMVTEDSATRAAGSNIGSTLASSASNSMQESFSETEAYQVGKTYTQAVSEGMRDPDMIDILNTTVDGIKSMMIDPIVDASIEFNDCGKAVIKGILNGIQLARNEGFEEVIDDVTNTIIDTFQEAAGSDVYRLEGVNIITQLCNGLKEEEAIAYLEIIMDDLLNIIVGTFKEADESNEFRKIGASIVSSICAGVSESMTQDGIRNLEFAAGNILAIFVELIGESAEDYKQCGHEVIHYFCEGLDTAKEQGLDESIMDLVERFKNMITKFDNMYFMLGKMMILGMIKGIISEAQHVAGVAASVASAALQAAKAAVNSHSPSKAFEELGRFMDEGLAIGLREYSGMAEDAAGEMASGTLSPVQQAIDQLSGMLDGSIDINPTITPTLDLSEVNARSAALSSMFSNRQIAVQTRSDEQQAEMMTQLGNVLAEQNSEPRSITFNQTNNSPKALSRTEIYRQTRNGFSQLVSAIN